MIKPTVTIAIQSINFGARLSWMLSSLADQSIASQIEVDVAYADDQTPIKTARIIELYQGRNGLVIRPRYYPTEDRFKYRGFVRNDQMRDWKTDFILYGDSDHVYHPEFFEKLLDHMRKDILSLDTYNLFWSAGRMSNKVEDANHLVDAMNFRLNGYLETTVIPDPWKEASKIPLHQKSNVGAGHTQIIHRGNEHFQNYYVDEQSNKDFDWHKKGANPKSDTQFRRRVKDAGTRHMKLPIWFTEHQIHLNHFRDRVDATHVLEQR